MRALVPAETLVYLETNDLAAALQPIVDAKPFMEVAKTRPDLSALKGVQLAVAVTGFETSEEKLTDEHSVGSVQPRFVAVADTHAWNSNAVAFAEKKLGSFVTNIYDSEPTLEKSDKHGGKYFTWTATDGRKAYALVIDSIIYVGNDESAIEKCLAVKRNESDSIAKTGKVQPADPQTLASGYVSTDGIAQIANIVGLKFASETDEDAEVQSAIAGIVPQLIRNSITEISWTATKTEQGIEDKYLIAMPSDVASVFNETMAVGEHDETAPFDWLPADVPTATRYNFKNAQVAWRSLLLVVQKQLDPTVAKALVAFSGLVFEPYGISDPEMFLSSGASGITTANFSADGDKPVLKISTFIDESKLQNSLLPSLRQQRSDGARHTDDGDIAAVQMDMRLISGDAEIVQSLYQFAIANDKKNTLGDTVPASLGKNAPILTVGQDTTVAQSLVEMLSNQVHGETQAVSTYFTETRFTKAGIDRRTVSDFGLIGSIIAQLSQD